MNRVVFRHPIHPQIPMMHYLPGAAPQRREIYEEEDLASIALQIQRKRFYVDVKRNKRGIFMKITEVGIDGYHGRKARILLTLNAAAEIRDKLKDLIDVLTEIEKKDDPPAETEVDEADTNTQKPVTGDWLIKSHIVNYPYRRYFLDLKRNRRGYFLRLAMLSTLNRMQLAVPAQGIPDLYNAMNELLGKWWDQSKSDDQKSVNLPESKALRVDNRTLYFDSSCNRYGPYLRISEVRSTSRTAITIPSRSLFRFRDIINGLADDLTNMKVSKVSCDEPIPEDPVVEQDYPTANGDIPT